jgi:hypothetical protein
MNLRRGRRTSHFGSGEVPGWYEEGRSRDFQVPIQLQTLQLNVEKVISHRLGFCFTLRCFTLLARSRHRKSMDI